MSIEAGSILPSLMLPGAADGALVGLRRGAGPRVVVSVHSASCTTCADYVREIASTEEITSRWGGGLVVIVPGSFEGASAGYRNAEQLQLLADPEGKFADGSAAVVVADEWGEIYFAMDAGDGHDFPTPEELGEWIRFISIQCPECENPEGEWKSI